MATPTHRVPSHPGEILQHEFLDQLPLAQTELAKRMKVPVQRINELCRGKRGVTAETALLLADALQTSPEFWMNLQMAFDLARAREKLLRAG